MSKARTRSGGGNPAVFAFAGLRFPGPCSASGMEPGIQHIVCEAPYLLCAAARLVMCWTPDTIPLALHGSGDRRCARLAPFAVLRRIAGMDRYWVYILASKRNGTLYIGVTNDIVRRVNEHKSKAFAGFTARHNVCTLVWHEEHSSIIDAQVREKSLKKWRRTWKLALIEKLNPAWVDLHEHLM